MSDYSGVRAGESLSPGVRALLEYLGVWDRFCREQTLQSWGNEAAWGSDDLSCLDFMFTVHGSGWALDRARFDRMLAQEVAARGGALLTGTRCLACSDTGSRWALTLKTGQTPALGLSAGHVVDAGGRASRLSLRHGGVRQFHDHLVGVAAQIRYPRGR